MAGAAAIGTTLVVTAQNDVGLSRRPSPLARSGLLNVASPGRPGDLIMTTMRGTAPSTELLRRIRDGEVAGVLLEQGNMETKDQVRQLTRALQAAAYAGGATEPLIIAVDQEGAGIRRVTWAPPADSARTMGGWSLGRIRQEGRATGRALRALGINVDLAPVADVPGRADNFLRSRAFATDVRRAATSACAFARGLRDVGVIPTLKHFPGLGGAGSRSTDAEIATITATRAQIRREVLAYAQCGTERGTLAMVANARYPALTGTTPALFSPATYELARTLGEPGPFITDSLSGTALAGQRMIGVRAVNAGAHLLLYTSEGTAIAGFRELARAAERGQIKLSTLTARAARVRALRAQLYTDG